VNRKKQKKEGGGSCGQGQWEGAGKETCGKEKPTEIQRVEKEQES
jgi:hypothetical protein